MPRPAKHVFICSQARPPGHPRGSCAEKGCREVMDEHLLGDMPIERLMVPADLW